MEAGSQAQNQMTSMNKAKSQGSFFYILTFRLALAFICSWGKSLTPHCGSTALCQAQGPVSVSSLILGADPLLMGSACPGLIYLVSVSKYQNHFCLTLQFLFLPSGHHDSGRLSPFKSRLREVSPSPPNSLSHVTQVYCLCISCHLQKLMPLFMGYFESFLVPLFSGLIVFLFFPAWLQYLLLEMSVDDRTMGWAE